METVPCPMCCNMKVPGQLERPRNGKWEGIEDSFGLNKLPAFVRSVPCPMCHGAGRIPLSEWDALLKLATRKEDKKKDNKKKAAEEYEKQKTIWAEMLQLKQQQDADWKEQGPFGIAKYRKAK